jgi:hypothetical protein
VRSSPHRFYPNCRFTLIHDLLPTLNRPGVRVLNILAAATGGMPDVDDLDLKKTFSLKRCADFTTTYSCVAYHPVDFVM